MTEKHQTYELYNAVTVGICVIDSNYNIAFWNDSMEQWTGLDKSTVENQSLMTLFPNFKEPVLKERLDSVFRDGLPVVISSKLHPTFFPSIWPQNADALHEIKISSTYNEKTHQRMAVFTVEDVTDHTRRLFEQRILYKRAMEEVRQRRKAEAELKKSELKLQEMIATKDKFFSIIAHDLKSPFASLLSYSDFMLTQDDDFDSSSVEMLLKTVNEMAKSGFSLLENLLTWSRLQTGRINYQPDILDIQSIFKGVIKTLSIQATEKNIRIDCGCEQVFVLADVNMIQTVIRNLIANAIKFSFPDSVITARMVSVNDEVCEFHIEDKGVGIPAKDMHKLFDITSQYTTMGTNNESGSGLGLILCKEFIELHEGQIWAESVEGEGTTFKFTLPRSK